MSCSEERSKCETELAEIQKQMREQSAESHCEWMSLVWKRVGVELGCSESQEAKVEVLDLRSQRKIEVLDLRSQKRIEVPE